MPTGPSRRDGAKETDAPGAGRPKPRVLVCSARSPQASPDHGVDVRPGVAASYNGGRVELALIVTGADRRVRLPWFDREELHDTVASMVASGTATFVRFGDRADCRRAIGPANTAVVERGLTRTARSADHPFVTWTTTPSGEIDKDAYDVVIERAGIVD